jgi:NADH-quinone oxidoreductase subunit N
MQIPSLAELNVGAALPGIIIALGACILLVIDLFLPRNRKDLTVWLSLLVLAISFVVNLFTFNSADQLALEGLFVADQFTGFLNLVVLIGAGLSILLSVDYLKRIDSARGEFYVLMLFSVAGAMFMASANDLIVIFVALELLSIPLYIMAAFRQSNAKSEESGMKYFILGAFASAFLVYGAALVYGATGTTSLPQIFSAVADIIASEGPERFYLVIGAGLVVVGLGFKVAVVPFHMWTPDVYEGAPTPATAFMSVTAKIGGFGALLRVMIIALPSLVFSPDGDTTTAAWQTTIWLIAAVTLILGNFVALSQNNIKRMLAYSSIAHAGYILMAVAAAGTPGISNNAAQGALFYLLAYTFSNLGAFAIAMTVERADGSGTNIEDFRGLGKRNPLLAAMMAIFLFSLAGVPMTAGFVGKWLVFQPTLQAGLAPLAIIGVLTSVVSAYYYVRITINMFFFDSADEAVDEEYDRSSLAVTSTYLNWAIYASFAGTILLGILPMLATNLVETVNLAMLLPR